MMMIIILIIDVDINRAYGCVAYEMCALSHPFEAKNNMQLVVKIISGTLRDHKRWGASMQHHFSNLPAITPRLLARGSRKGIT